MWSHCLVISHYKIAEYSMPLNYRLYLRKEFLGKKANKLFKSKPQLAKQLIDEFAPVTEITYLLIDAWYTPTYIICTDLTLDSETIIQHYANRWDIEVSYRYHKATLGFDEFQVESLTSIKRFWSLVYRTYSFLELFKASNKKILKFQTLGDVIRHFRNKCLAQIVMFVYTCAENG